MVLVIDQAWPGNSELIGVSLKMYHMLLILQAQDRAMEQNVD
jgi:hypothetical protein